MKPKLAIACQGGGAHAAFTAGVLQTLFEHGIQDHYEIVSVSGTSGGAICAALIWYALKKGEQPVWQRLLDFWQDNTAQSAPEQFFNNFAIHTLNLTSKGLLPQFNVSPASMLLQNWMSFTTAALGLRSRFTDLRELLSTHISFPELATWGAQPEPPILVLGACNILTGKLWMFDSYHQPVQVEHILASCAIPNLFPAVEIGADAYWDGVFSDNPPITELINPYYVGNENIPDEIWVIKINPTGRDSIPVEPDDILDRRNELLGNISLFQSLYSVERINDFIIGGAFQPEYLQRYPHLQHPIKIPKSFVEQEDKPYHIPFIEMSSALQKSLNYESKLDRNPDRIAQMLLDGRRQADQFLRQHLTAETNPTSP
uniref:Patatin n=1 Tax=Cyanothece sp. (strain PCC 7425 / ATCC 29141) TaxID=395961 RepID=B8HW89_CYAP4